MPKRDPYIISRINYRRIFLVTSISALLVIIILFGFLMESGMTLSFKNLARLHMDHPPLFMIDLLPLFIFAFLHPMHRIMNRAIEEYEDRVKESTQLLERNTDFAKEI